MAVDVVTGFQSALSPSTGHIYCAPCSLGIYRPQEVRDGEYHRCHMCGKDASYPFHREAKLYHLDSHWVKRITGMEYDELRRYASGLTTGGDDENMNDPAWNLILDLDARTVWEERQNYARREALKYHPCAGCGETVEANERYCEYCDGGSFSMAARYGDREDYYGSY